MHANCVAESCKGELVNLLRCLGLVEGVGTGNQTMAMSAKMVLVTTMLDCLRENGEHTDLKLQMMASEAAEKLNKFAPSKGSLGVAAGAVAALAQGAGAGMPMVVGDKPNTRCHNCGLMGHYANKCDVMRAAYNLPIIPKYGGGYAGGGYGMGGMGRGAGRGYAAGFMGGYGAQLQAPGVPAQGALALPGPPGAAGGMAGQGM